MAENKTTVKAKGVKPYEPYEYNWATVGARPSGGGIVADSQYITIPDSLDSWMSTNAPNYYTSPDPDLESNKKSWMSHAEAQLSHAREYVAGIDPIYPITPDDAVKEYNWKENFDSISNRRRSPKSKYDTNPKNFNFKSSYTLDQCLSVFRDLFDREFGEIYLTGSVALKLQNKINRSSFKDLDIVVVGEYALDDDIYDNPQMREYRQNANLGKQRGLAFNNVPIDAFEMPSDYKINYVSVDYKNNTYVCQDYRDIIKAKLEMILPQMKDYADIKGNCFEIAYK